MTHDHFHRFYENWAPFGRGKSRFHDAFQQQALKCLQRQIRV